MKALFVSSATNKRRCWCLLVPLLFWGSLISAADCDRLKLLLCACFFRCSCFIAWAFLEIFPLFVPLFFVQSVQRRALHRIASEALLINDNSSEQKTRECKWKKRQRDWRHTLWIFVVWLTQQLFPHCCYKQMRIFTHTNTLPLCFFSSFPAKDFE